MELPYRDASTGPLAEKPDAAACSVIISLCLNFLPVDGQVIVGYAKVSAVDSSI